MAAIFDVAAEGLERTTDIVAASSGYEIDTWVYVGGTPATGTYQTLIYKGNDPFTLYTEYVWVGQGDDGLLSLELTGAVQTQGSSLSVGWHHIAYTLEGTIHSVYLDNVLDITDTLDVSAETHTHVYVGTDTAAIPWDPGKAKQVRERTVVLSDSERGAEMVSATAVALTGLVSDAPLVSDFLDISGNDNHWTPYGDVTFESEERPPASEYGGGTPTILTDTYSDHDMQCPASWENGFKAGIVKRFGEGDRAASHPWTGDWQGSSFSLTLIDNGQFRRQLRSTTDRYWVESLTIRMTTRANRAALGVPWTVFVGPIINITLPEPTLMELTLGDIVSQGILSDHPIPFRKIGDGPLSLFDEVYESLDREAPEPQIYGYHRRTTDDAASPQGFEYVPTKIGIRTIGASQYYTWMIAGHALADLFAVQKVTPGTGSPLNVHETLAEGAEWLFPHHAGYLAQFGAHYEDLRSDTYGVDRRYSFLYGKVGEADPEAAWNDEVTLVVHLAGAEPNADGTGTVITDRYEQYKHWLINYVANFGAASYMSGAWLTNPTWDVFGVAKTIIDEASFDACSAIAAGRLPVMAIDQDYAAGYIGAAIIGARTGDRSSVKRWIADWNRSCQVRFGVNHYGQIVVFMLHPTEAIKGNAPLYTDAYEILEGSFRPTFGWPEKVNRVPFKTDYHHETGVWRTVGVAESPDAILNYNKAISSEDREYPFAPGITMANHLAVLESRIRKHPPTHVVLEATIGPDYNNDSLGYLDLGDYIRYTHYGAIAEANEIRLAQIVRHQVQAGRRVVQIEAFDCEELIGFDDPDIVNPPPVEASPTERNDTCATALEVVQAPWTPYAIVLDTTEHVRDTSVEGSPALLPAPAEAHHPAWFKFTPWADGTLFLTTVHSLYDTQMAVLTGVCGGSPTWELIQFNDNDGFLSTSVLEFAVTGGVELHVLVYGYGPDDGGSLTFGLYFTEPE